MLIGPADRRTDLRPSEAAGLRPGQPPTVLVVDDDQLMRKMLHVQLEQAGYSVCSASNGHDALRTCHQSIQPLDLLVTDLNMPHMSGLDLAARAVRLLPPLRIIVISGAACEEELQVCRERGWMFLSKPFRPEQLLESVRESLVGVAS